MKRGFSVWLIGMMCFFLLLAGCNDAGDGATKAQVVRPVKTSKLGMSSHELTRRYPAQIYASRRAELSFRVAGKVVKLWVSEGDTVKKGKTLAQLDPADYQLAVNDAKAQFHRSKSNYERAKALVDKGHISRMDYDKLESEFKSASAGLARAKNDLAYTSLRAPFDGRVAKRYIQKFEEVQAKQSVFSLQSQDKLDVKFNVPESVILRIRRRTTQVDARKRVAERTPYVFVVFSNSEKKYPLLFKEIATRADEKTRTFEVTFTLDAPKKITVLPGMTAEVEVNFSAVYEKGSKGLWLPVSAVFADPEGSKRQFVWLVDEANMQVSLHDVQVGRLSGDQIEVLSGLNGDERIVTAGVHSLRQDQKVRLFDGKL